LIFRDIYKNKQKPVDPQSHDFLIPIRQDLASLSDRITIVEKEFIEIAKGVTANEKGLTALTH
jgi:hypothetical protein